MMKMMLMGYTGRGFIAKSDSSMSGDGGSCQIHLSSYSLSFSTNVMKSEGSNRIYRTDGTGFHKFSLNAVRDCPTYNISMSIEARHDIMDFLLASMVKAGFHDAYTVTFQDANSGVIYKFEHCYVTDMQLQVSNNSAASISLTFCHFDSTFEVKNGQYNLEPWCNGSGMAGESIMPYYSFKVDYTGFPSTNLQEFSFSFSHTASPKYGCTGSLSLIALAPMACVFSVPTVTYNLKYVMYDELSSYDYDIASNSIISCKSKYNKKKSMKISYKKINNKPYVRDNYYFLLNCDLCYPDTYTPEVGVSGSVNSISIAGTVYGQLTYESETPEGYRDPLKDN